MGLLEFLAGQPAAYGALVAVLGLIVGSFLNVVVHRLPAMMEREWRRQCAEIATGAAPAAEPAPYDLVRPRSRCPHCGHGITALENIPILSFLWLRGRCSACRAPISVRYPLVEALTALLSLAVAWRFGFAWHAAAALLLTWALVPLALIDLDHQLLPDDITLPWLWLGLAVNHLGGFVPLADAMLGAMLGYLALWSVYWLFKLLTGKEGMGHGDFKLLAMLGAWLGWQQLPVVILLSSVAGALVGLALITLGGRSRQVPIPFGPYLAAAGWVALLWGEQLVQAYLGTLA